MKHCPHDSKLCYYLLFRNQIKLKTFLFIDIWFVKQDIKKWLKTKICSLYGEFENEKKKKDKIFFWPSGLGIRAPDFLIFPPMIWIFKEGKGDGIKSRQPSKIFSTLPASLFDVPKSEILTTPLYVLTRTLSPLMSLWTIFCSCKYLSPSKICLE